MHADMMPRRLSLGNVELPGISEPSLPERPEWHRQN